MLSISTLFVEQYDNLADCSNFSAQVPFLKLQTSALDQWFSVSDMSVPSLDQTW